MKQLSFVIGGILLISATAAPAAPHRGVWFWNTTEVDGSDRVPIAPSWLLALPQAALKMKRSPS